MTSGSGFSVAYDDHDQTLSLVGCLRPQSSVELAETIRTLYSAAEKVSGSLYFDVKRLGKINNVAFKELVTFFQWISENRSDLNVKIVTTSVITWAQKKFWLLSRLSPNFVLEQYDTDFYPGQGAIENASFIPVVRTQTKIIWQKEQHVLRAHGLREGAQIADICCGIGDFAVLVHKAFKPRELVAVDHSKPFLHYARQVAKDFGISTIQYLYGDAAALMLEDDRFDFVTCRLSLQIFDRPDLILKELYRICKPGGRVYLTNETYSKCFGEPHSESIAWTYREASRLFAGRGMNLEFGLKMRRYLKDCGFTDIQIEPMIVTNLDVAPEDFCEVIKSWEDYVVGDLAGDAGEDEAFCRKMRQGFQDHRDAIMHPKGFAGWPIWVGSGTKPRA